MKSLWLQLISFAYWREEYFTTFFCEWFWRYIIPKTWMYRHRCGNLLTSYQTFPDLTAIIYSALSEDSPNVFFYITLFIGGKVKILPHHMLNIEDRLFMMHFVVDYKSSRISRGKWKSRVYLSMQILNLWFFRAIGLIFCLNCVVESSE